MANLALAFILSRFLGLKAFTKRPKLEGSHLDLLFHCIQQTIAEYHTSTSIINKEREKEKKTIHQQTTWQVDTWHTVKCHYQQTCPKEKLNICKKFTQKENRDAVKKVRESYSYIVALGD